MKFYIAIITAALMITSSLAVSSQVNIPGGWIDKAPEDNSNNPMANMTLGPQVEYAVNAVSKLCAVAAKVADRAMTAAWENQDAIANCTTALAKGAAKAIHRVGSTVVTYAQTDECQETVKDACKSIRGVVQKTAEHMKSDEFQKVINNATTGAATLVNKGIDYANSEQFKEDACKTGKMVWDGAKYVVGAVVNNCFESSSSISTSSKTEITETKSTQEPATGANANANAEAAAIETDNGNNQKLDVPSSASSVTVSSCALAFALIILYF